MYSRHDLQIVKPIKEKHRHFKNSKQDKEQDKHEIIIDEKAFNAEILPLLLFKLVKGIFNYKNLLLTLNCQPVRLLGYDLVLKIMPNNPRRGKGQIF